MGAELRRLLHRAQRKGRSAPVCTVPSWHAAFAARRWPLAGLRAAKGPLAPDAEPHTAAVDAFVSQTRRATSFATPCSAAVVCVVCRLQQTTVCRVRFIVACVWRIAYGVPTLTLTHLVHCYVVTVSVSVVLDTVCRLLYTCIYM